MVEWWAVSLVLLMGHLRVELSAEWSAMPKAASLVVSMDVLKVQQSVERLVELWVVLLADQSVAM